MRAWRLTDPAPVESAPLELCDLPTPSPGHGEILVQVRACGICRTDLHVVEGDLAPRLPNVIPGHQVVGTVAALAPDVTSLRIGERVGVAWLHRTCGACGFCSAHRENLCDNAEFTGWTRNGGFAEYRIAVADFIYPLPGELSDVQAAPLLCAGIIGYRALRLTGLDERNGGWSGARLGIYGFGAAGHIAIQLARARGARVYVCTRDRARHQALARELGAEWIGNAADPPPEKLDASIIFAPAGELVPPALAALDKGGVLVLAGIHMSTIPPLDYRALYQERIVRSVANNTRADGREFLAEAARTRVHTHTVEFPLESAGDALRALKNDALRGAGVLCMV
jgi:alcohol dehydrogenase, propanol-preferring